MDAQYIIGAARRDQFPPEGLPEVAFLGRSNVGKSSLLNCLLGGRQLAHTSSKPGCTQLIHFYRVDGRICFVDLPGYGYARVPKQMKAGWKELIEAYLVGRERLALSILLVDVRRGWMEKDLELKRWLEFHNRRHLVVATKMDKLRNQSEQKRGLDAIRQHLPGGDPVPFSAIDGRGSREIWQAIWKTQNRP
ncbi:MAG: ribosome biogenesis GTP-binding protein YihA/YsxC [Acidobacteriota bacterium]